MISIFQVTDLVSLEFDSGVHSEVEAELPDEFRSLVLFNILLQSGGGHRTEAEQVQQLSTQRPVGGLDGLSEPLIEELPALLVQEMLYQFCGGGPQDLYVYHFGDKFLGELLHQLDESANLQRVNILLLSETLTRCSPPLET